MQHVRYFSYAIFRTDWAKGHGLLLKHTSYAVGYPQCNPTTSVIYHMSSGTYSLKSPNVSKRLFVHTWPGEPISWKCQLRPSPLVQQQV